MLTLLDSTPIAPKLSSQTIVQRGVRKLYYVVSGRNAWWSTWVKRYQTGCMHLELHEAKKYAERLRTNGSVFYIQEIPAFVIQGETSTLVVTQINCKIVLAAYRPNGYPAYRKKIKRPENHILPGAQLSLTVNSFASDSRYWEVRPSPNDSVLLFTTAVPLKDFEIYRDSSITQYKSKSSGGQYSLSWHQSPFPVMSKALRNIMRLRRGAASEVKLPVERTAFE